jgi:hypothetical protein
LAADLSGQSPPDLIQTASVLAGYEFRAGVLGSTWGPEKGDPYLNGEVIFPKFLHAEGWADNFIPRLQLGGMGNLAGGTSYVYAGRSGGRITTASSPISRWAAPSTTATQAGLRTRIETR